MSSSFCTRIGSVWKVRLKRIRAFCVICCAAPIFAFSAPITPTDAGDGETHHEITGSVATSTLNTDDGASLTRTDPSAALAYGKRGQTFQFQYVRAVSEEGRRDGGERQGSAYTFAGTTFVGAESDDAQIRISTEWSAEEIGLVDSRGFTYYIHDSSVVFPDLTQSPETSDAPAHLAIQVPVLTDTLALDKTVTVGPGVDWDIGVDTCICACSCCPSCLGWMTGFTTTLLCSEGAH